MPGEGGPKYRDFASIWSRASLIPGWLTEEQGRELWGLALDRPPGGLGLEIGSHQGRSTLVLAAALETRGASLVAVDPFVEGRLFGGPSTRTRFDDNIEASGLAGTTRLIAERSTAVRPTWTEPIGLLYIDGKHDYWTVTDDLRWVAHLSPGSAVAIHDAFSSVGVTLALVAHVLPGRDLRFVRRTGSLAVFRRAAPTRLDRLRLCAQLPWFARNLFIKIGLRVGRAFGHHRPDPY